jgi:hypothetical protein
VGPRLGEMRAGPPAADSGPVSVTSASSRSDPRGGRPGRPVVSTLGPGRRGRSNRGDVQTQERDPNHFTALRSPTGARHDGPTIARVPSLAAACVEAVRRGLRAVSHPIAERTCSTGAGLARTSGSEAASRPPSPRLTSQTTASNPRCSAPGLARGRPESAGRRPRVRAQPLRRQHAVDEGTVLRRRLPFRLRVRCAAPRPARRLGAPDRNRTQRQRREPSTRGCAPQRSSATRLDGRRDGSLGADAVVDREAVR